MTGLQLLLVCHKDRVIQRRKAGKPDGGIATDHLHCYIVREIRGRNGGKPDGGIATLPPVVPSPVHVPVGMEQKPDEGLQRIVLRKGVQRIVLRKGVPVYGGRNGAEARLGLHLFLDCIIDFVGIG